MDYLARVAFWWFLSIVKFLIAPFAMIFNPGAEHWTWLETILITSSGAALGVFIFFHAGEYFIALWHFVFGKKKKKIFSPWKRRIIRLKWRWGIKGLMLISVLISVPVASVIAAKFYRHNNKALPMMIIGFFLWSLILTSIAYGIRVFELSL